MMFSSSTDNREGRTRDEIAFGIVTSQQDAMLLQVESHDSDDNIEIELVCCAFAKTCNHFWLLVHCIFIPPD